MKFSAKFIKMLTPQTGSRPNGNWIKQEVVVETKENYPKKVVLTNWNNQFDITSLKEDSYYDFELLLESKAYNGGYYSSAIIVGQPKLIQDNTTGLVGFQVFQLKMKISSFLPETKGANWTKRELIFDPIEQGYKSLTAFVLNNKVDSSSFTVGDEVSLDFYIEGREYNQKWYNDFKIWKIELIRKGSSNGQQTFNLTEPDSWPF